MRRITVGGISKYGECSKAIEELAISEDYEHKGNIPNKKGNDSTEKGTAIHEIIQSILNKNISERGRYKQLIIDSLNKTRKECKIDNNILEIIDNDILKGSLKQKMIQDLANDGIALIDCSMNFIEKIEEIWPESKNSWEIEIEFEIHDNKRTRKILQREIFLENIKIKGSIDLVLEWENIVNIVEIKTGNTYDMEIWSNQVSTYAKCWKELFNDGRDVYAWIIHQFDDGYDWVKDIEEKSTLDYSFQKEVRKIGQGCKYCDLNYKCPKYKE